MAPFCDCQREKAPGAVAESSRPHVCDLPAWATLAQRDITPVIPPKANRKVQRDCDYELYRERNLIERFFNKIKHFRAIATRYDKLARNFLAAIQLVSAIILLN